MQTVLADKAIGVFWQQFLMHMCLSFRGWLTGSWNISRIRLCEWHSLIDLTKMRLHTHKISTPLHYTFNIFVNQDLTYRYNINHITWSLLEASAPDVLSLFTMWTQFNISPSSSSTKFWSDTSEEPNNSAKTKLLCK